MKPLAPPLLLAAAALLSGCSSSPGPAPIPTPIPAAAAAAASTPPGVPCGTVATPGGKSADVVAHGAIDCGAARQVFTRYFGQLTAAQADAPDGAGPVVVDEWTCGSAGGAPVTTCSTEDGRELDATRH